MSLVAGRVLVGCSNLIHRCEFPLPAAGMTTVDELSAFSFPQTEHLLSSLRICPISVCVGNLDVEMAPMFEAHK